LIRCRGRLKYTLNYLVSIEGDEDEGEGGIVGGIVDGNQ